MKRSAPHTPRYSNDDKNLIAEQSGKFVLVSGVLLAIVLGLIVRGVLAPNKVKAQITAAASSINKDLQVQFGTAFVSLSNGLLPRFAVVITDVKMESSNPCWMTPVLTADEIRLPLSFWALVYGENPVSEVGAGNVSVELRTAYKNCDEHPAAASSQSPLAPAVKQFVTLKNKKSEPVAKASHSQVDAISIDQLTIVAPVLSAPLELSSFSVRVKSNAPKVIEMNAKTHLIRDEQFGDYLSHASVWAEFTEFPKTQVLGRISGNWREGSYELNTRYAVKDEVLTGEMDLKHVPLSQVGQILKRFKWVREDFNPRQVWVSVHGEVAGKSTTLKSARMTVRDLRLEGDLGDIRVPQAEVTSFDPLRYEPFHVDVEKLNIEKVLALANKPHPTQALGQLGHFSGRADVMSPEQLQIQGVLRGLEFIFSNKGQRELQTLKEVSTTIRLEKNRWELETSKAAVDQGKLDGHLKMSADRDLRNVDIDAKIKELRLAPNIIRLMTANGKVGALSSEFKVKLREGKGSELRGTIATDEVLVEGVGFSKSRWHLDSGKNEFTAQAQFQDVTIAAGSASFQGVKELIDPEWMSDGKLDIRALSAQLQFPEDQGLKAFSWKNLTAQLAKGGRVTSDGHWDTNGNLSGQIQSAGGKTPSQRWILGGRRDRPIFALNESSKKKKQ